MVQAPIYLWCLPSDVCRAVAFLRPALYQALRPCSHFLQAELDALLKDYVGRPSPLYHADRLSEHYRRCAGYWLLLDFMVQHIAHIKSRRGMSCRLPPERALPQVRTLLAAAAAVALLHCMLLLAVARPHALPTRLASRPGRSPRCA